MAGVTAPNWNTEAFGRRLTNQTQTAHKIYMDPGEFSKRKDAMIADDGFPPPAHGKRWDPLAVDLWFMSKWPEGRSKRSPNTAKRDDS